MKLEENFSQNKGAFNELQKPLRLSVIFLSPTYYRGNRRVDVVGELVIGQNVVMGFHRSVSPATPIIRADFNLTSQSEDFTSISCSSRFPVKVYLCPSSKS